MWSVFVVVSAIFIIAYELPPLLKQRKKRDTAVFWMLLGVGFALSFAHSMDVEIINPLDIISMVYKPLGQMLIVVPPER